MLCMTVMGPNWRGYCMYYCVQGSDHAKMQYDPLEVVVDYQQLHLGIEV